MTMERPQSTDQNTISEFVQQQRDELYATGHRNLNMSLSAETIERIDDIKKRHRRRSRDTVVARFIRACMETTGPDASAQRPADPDTSFRRISPIVAADLDAYVRRIQLRFCGLTHGPVFEMTLAEVGDDLGAATVPTDRLAEGFSARKHEPSPSRPHD